MIKIHKIFINWKFQLLLIILITFMLIQFFRLDIKQYPNNTNNYSKINNKTIELFANSNSNSSNKSNTRLENEFKLNFVKSKDADIIFNNSTYLDTMNSVNIYARSADYDKDDTINSYTNCLLSITKKERARLEKLVTLLLYKLRDTELYHFIKSNLVNIKFAKGNNWLEQGLPHTHPNIIVLPPSFYADLRQIDNLDLDNLENVGDNYDKLLTDNASTIIHELVHIHQRRNTYIYTELYNKWGFKKAKYFDNMEIITTLNRHNPDALDIKWVWYNKNDKKYYWIGAVFKNKKPDGLHDVIYIAYPVSAVFEGGYKYIESIKPMYLNEFSDFTNNFGHSSNHYHPNEIIAQFMEYYYLKIIGVKDDLFMLDKEAYRLFLRWISTINN